MSEAEYSESPEAQAEREWLEELERIRYEELQAMQEDLERALFEELNNQQEEF